MATPFRSRPAIVTNFAAAYKSHLNWFILRNNFLLGSNQHNCLRHTNEIKLRGICISEVEFSFLENIYGEDGHGAECIMKAILMITM